MGSRQLFCLRWSNHQTNMLSVFDELLQNEALVDVTIACEGLSIKAHKVVLSACSPYFQNLFVQNPCKHPIVILKDIKYSELKALVDFMYKGEVNVTQEQLNALLKTAESLKIKGLAEVTGGLNGQNERADASSTPPPPLPLLPPPLPPLVASSPQQPRGHHHHPRRNLPPASSTCGDITPPPPPPVPVVAPCPGAASSSSSSSSSSVSCVKLELSSQPQQPPHKRRKTRHRRKSADKGGGKGAGNGESDGECGDAAARGSTPEVIEAKVEMEMAEEEGDGFDSGPGRPPDADADAADCGAARSDRPSDAASESVHDTSSQGSFRSQDLGPPSVRSDELAVAPSSTRLKPSFAFEPPIGAASTSGEGSSQGGGDGAAAAMNLRLDYGPGYIPKRGQPRIMNVDEEQMIVNFILDMAAKGRPVTRRCVLEYGNTLLRRHDRVPTGSIHCNPEKGLSNDWWKEFKKRHPGLPLRSSSSSSSSSSTSSSQHHQLPSSV